MGFLKNDTQQDPMKCIMQQIPIVFTRLWFVSPDRNRMPTYQRQ